MILSGHFQTLQVLDQEHVHDQLNWFPIWIFISQHTNTKYKAKQSFFDSLHYQILDEKCQTKLCWICWLIALKTTLTASYPEWNIHACVDWLIRDAERLVDWMDKGQVKQYKWPLLPLILCNFVIEYKVNRRGEEGQSDFEIQAK